MPRSRSFLLALAASLLATVGCAPLEGPKWEPEPPAQAIDLGERGSEPLSFRKVVYRIPSNAVLGEIRIGRATREEMRWTVGRRQSTTFNVAVTDGLRRLGYDVRDEADSLFDPNDRVKVRYEMAAILHDASVDFQYRMNRARDGAGDGVGTAEVDVEVRLHDALEKKTVYSRRFTARGRDEGTKPNPLMSAVVAAILKSAEDPAFVAIVTSGRVGDSSGEEGAPAVFEIARCSAPGGDVLPEELPGTLESVVEIHAGSVGGTGVIISPDGWILTAAHVVRDAPELWVRVDAGTQLPATLHQSDAAADLALLRIPGRNHACARVRTTDGALDLGSDVFAVNVAIGEDGQPTITRGVVSGFPIKDGQRFIQTDASMNPGSSGGPLLAPDGTVAGISVLKVVGRGVEGLGLAVPAEEAIRQLDIELVEAPGLR